MVLSAPHNAAVSRDPTPGLTRKQEEAQEKRRSHKGSATWGMGP